MAISDFVNNIVTMFQNSEEKEIMHYISYLFLFWGASVFISLQTVTAPYGRYSRAGWGFTVPVKFAWLVQEVPSFVMPLLLILYTPCRNLNNMGNMFALGLFLLHYFQRTFVFSLLIRGGKNTPLVPFVLAIVFCTLNGYLQGGYLLKYAVIEVTTATMPRIILGTVVFFSGFLINVHSDSILRNLRKGTETGYIIPRGGMFEYISGANFFGEILEWTGFFIINWTLPSFAFAIFTALNIGPRALHHHEWYKQKFDDYPKARKALIPFVL